MSYAHQKFWEAVNCLVGDGPIETRLAGAGMSLTLLSADDLPHESRSEYKEIMQTLGRFTAVRAGEGTLHSSARYLSSEEATALAEKIFAFYTELHGGIGA